MMRLQARRRRRVSGAAAAFDPATLSLDGWYRASFGGDPWTPTASAGSSGSNGNLIAVAAAPPTVGTSVNSLDPATFNGTTQALSTGTAATTDLITAASLTVVMLIKASAATAIAADFYSDPALMTDGSGNWGLVFTDGGVRAGTFVGSTHQTTSIALATGVWALAAMRYDGANIKCRVSQASGTTDATPVASGNPTLVAAPYWGRNYAGAAFFAGDVLEIMTSKSVLSDANLASLTGYANSRYGLSLT